MCFMLQIHYTINILNHSIVSAFVYKLVGKDFFLKVCRIVFCITFGINAMPRSQDECSAFSNTGIISAYFNDDKSGAAGG